MDHEARFLLGLRIVPSRVLHEDYPFHLPLLRTLNLEFDHAVTFFVGENGAGKSTVMEALASLCGYPPDGGGRNELDADHSPESEAALAFALRPSFRVRPRDGYFFRAEFQSHFASLLDQRRDDPGFAGDPYARYGGRSLHERSHGEAFLSVFAHRLQHGLYLMDEPESALSPQRQLELLARMAQLVKHDGAQFIVATHSPILLTFPGATILSFDGHEVQPIELEDSTHFQITKGILDNPERYWRHLLAD